MNKQIRSASMWIAVQIAAGSMVLSGCATVATVGGQIPLVSIAVDQTDFNRLSKALTLGEAELEVFLPRKELIEIANRPLPSPPGVSYEVAVVRRAMAGFLLNDAAILNWFERERNRLQNPEFRVLGSFLAIAQHQNNGRAFRAQSLHQSEQALFRDRPSAWSAELLIAKAFAISGLTEYAESIVRGRPARIDGLKDVSAIEARDYRIEYVGVQSILSQARGEKHETATMLLSQTDELYTLLTRDRASNPSAYSKSIVNLTGLMADGAIIALHAGDFATYQTMRTRLGSLRLREPPSDQVAFDRALNRVQMQYEALHGHFEQAFQRSQRQWAQENAIAKQTRYARVMYAIDEANYLIGAKRYADARARLRIPEFTLTGTDEGDPFVLAGALSDTFAQTKLAGLERVDLRRVQALKKWKSSSGTRLALTYEMTMTHAHWHNYQRGRNVADLRQALDHGAEFSRAIEAYRAALTTRMSPVQKVGVEESVTAYVAAAIEAWRIGIGDKERVFDALRLAQMSEADDDVSVAAIRRQRGAGLSAEETRTLQLAEQSVRAAQRELDALDRLVDVDQQTRTAALEKLTAARARVATVSAALRARAPGFVRLFERANTSISQVQRSLPSRGALLVVHPLPSETVSILITQRESHVVVLPASAAEFDRLADRLLASTQIGSGPQLPPFDSEASHTLYRLIFSELEKPLSSVQNLDVVLHGGLSRVPAGALLRQPLRSGDYTRAQWLIKDFSITSSLSIESWLRTRSASRTASGATRLRSWADPDFDGNQSALATAQPGGSAANSTRRNLVVLPRAQPADSEPEITVAPSVAVPRLPDTLVEAQSLARSLGADPRTSIIYGDAATRRSVIEASNAGELRGLDVLHFATHGVAAGEAGSTQPALVLAREPRSGRAGLLRADDVMALDIDASLLILSACNTASGDGVQEKSAFSGLARAFNFAGARNIIATHWAVETASATEYVSLLGGHVAQHRGDGAARAVRAVATRMATGRAKNKEWAHPAFWAPFVVFGDGIR